MRKDVRMGFAVGGVLLAVVIVAVLVMHRNKNPNKVAFGPGNGSTTAGASSEDKGPIDVAGPGGAVADRSSQPLSLAKKDAGPADKVRGSAGSSDDDADSAGRRWDMLFASTADDPIKAELTSAKVRRHKSQKAQVAADSSVERLATADLQQPVDPQTDAAAPRGSDRSQPAASNPDSDRAPASTGPRTHKVQPGETFVTIARAVYGNGKYFKALEKANPKVDPRALKPGMAIQLPPASEVKQPARTAGKAQARSPQSGPAAASDGSTYTVQKDDSLYKIAHRLYPGKRGIEDELYLLNKQVIGPDSTKLKPGMVLKLPAAATLTAKR